MNSATVNDPAMRGRGNLLYMEEWGRRSRFKSRMYAVVGGVMLLTGPIGIGIGMYSMISIINRGGTLLSAVLSVATLIYLIIGIIFIISGYFTFSKVIQHRPFKVYTRGFTLPMVSPLYGFLQKDIFIEWERVNKVLLKKPGKYGEGKYAIVIEYDLGRVVELNDDNLSDPLKVIKLMKKYIPEKMTKNLKKLTSKKVKIKGAEYWLEPQYRWMAPVFVIFLLVIISFGQLRTPPGEGALPLQYEMLFNLILMIIILILSWQAVNLERDDNDEKIYNEVEARKEGIKMPSTLYGKMIRNVRKIVPYDDVKRVNLKLCPERYTHECEVVFFSGEKYRMPISVYKKVSKRSDFTKKGQDYINISPIKMGEPVSVIDYRKVMFLTMIYIFPSTVRIIQILCKYMGL